MNRIGKKIIRSFAAVLLGASLVGCVAVVSNHPYTPGPHEAIPVPQGARIIAFGHYPVGPFAIPREPGSLYVWDDDAGKVSYMATISSDTPQTTDLNQLSKNSFDPTHNYRVYFIPVSAMTTQPAAAQQ